MVVRHLLAAVGAWCMIATAEATPPPKPQPVPAGMLSDGTLRLSAPEGFVLLDAPGKDWQWTHVGDSYYRCDQGMAAVEAGAQILQVFRVAKVPSRSEAQAELDRRHTVKWEHEEITSREATTHPVPGTVRYTLLATIQKSTPRRYIGYYTPQGFHLPGPDDDSAEAAVYRRFVASYRVAPGNQQK